MPVERFGLKLECASFVNSSKLAVQSGGWNVAWSIRRPIDGFE